MNFLMICVFEKDFKNYCTISVFRKIANNNCI